MSPFMLMSHYIKFSVTSSVPLLPQTNAQQAKREKWAPTHLLKFMTKRSLSDQIVILILLAINHIVS